MTRRLAAAGALAMMTSLVAIADTPAIQNKPVTLTGCVRTGSAATVFILRGATDPASMPEEAAPAATLPADYLIAAVPDSVNIADHVNHRVEVSAVVTDPSEPPGPPPGANTAERAMKRISIRSLKMVASNCAS
jgi:hypothetical protein